MKIGWLDFSEEEKQRVLKLIISFNEKGTVDQLGLGSIRDAFSDMLFPGTSTLHTRARYFLFIPWIYLSLEGKKISSSQIREKARKAEIGLINSLLDGGEKEGVIGIDAKEDLQILPSERYWNALFIWGIRSDGGSQSRYHGFLDTYYNLNTNEVNDDNEPIGGKYQANWHLGIPPAPSSFLDKTTFKLEKSEALYLMDRYLVRNRESMLAYLIGTKELYDEVMLPWMHPLINEFPEKLSLWLQHARHFSEIMWGAALLYNYMLAELSSDEGLMIGYNKKIEDWAQMIGNQRGIYAKWHLHEFWDVMKSEKKVIKDPTREFVNSWIYRCMELKKLDGIVNDRRARDMIILRERATKPELGRFDHPRALENWGGESSASQIDYRWPIAQIIINDIVAGLKG